MNSTFASTTYEPSTTGCWCKGTLTAAGSFGTFDGPAALVGNCATYASFLSAYACQNVMYTNTTCIGKSKSLLCLFSSVYSNLFSDLLICFLILLSF